MLYREIIAVCSQIHTKHIITLCGQNVELLNVKPAVHSVQNILSSTLLSKNIKIKIYRTIILSVVLYEPENKQLLFPCTALNGFYNRDLTL